VATMLRYAVNPPPPNPEMTRMQERTRQYREQVEEQFRKTRHPGTGAGFGGGGASTGKGGKGYGHHSFGYWDSDAEVRQSMHFCRGQELETMERFAVSADGTKLIYEEEIASGGKTVRRVDEFPFRETAGSEG
jgi:hypothetical protein